MNNELKDIKRQLWRLTKVINEVHKSFSEFIQKETVPDRMITVKEAAQYLFSTLENIREEIRKGHLNARKHKGKYYLSLRTVCNIVGISDLRIYRDFRKTQEWSNSNTGYNSDTSSLTTYQIKATESEKLRSFLATMSKTEHRFFVEDVLLKCKGSKFTKKTFYNWKYGNCRIPLFAKRAIEEVAGNEIFLWTPDYI